MSSFYCLNEYKGPRPPTERSEEKRKFDMDLAIMATVLLDLQPINQVNRY